MKMNKTLAVAALAGLFAAGVAVQARAEDKPKAEKKGGKKPAGVHCTGVNACKGQGECGGDGHGCKGQNACKGKGWTALSKKDCKAKGGAVQAPAKKKA